MKIKELLEAGVDRIGHVLPDVDTVDTTAPWTKKGMGVARARTKELKKSDTSTKEKLDYLAKESNGFTKGNIGLRFEVSGKPLILDEYNKTTGELTLRVPNPGKIVKTYTLNIDQFKYDGRERGVSTRIVYMFSSDSPLPKPVQEPKAGFKSQAGIDRTPHKTRSVSKSAEKTLKKANNPFGL